MTRRWTGPPPAEGRRHLRLGGAPALAAAAPAGARLGHPDADAARGRARRVGLRAGAEATRRAARLDAAARRRRPARVLRARRLPRAPPARDPAHASRARRRLRPDGRAAGARAGALLDEARLQRVPRGPGFALGDRTVASLAHVHIAISRGLARYLAETEGFAEDELRDRPLRHHARRRAGAVRGRRAAAAVRRAPDSDQGPHRAAAGVRGRAAGGPGSRAGHRRPRPARAGAAGARAGARDRRRRPLPRPCHADPERDRAAPPSWSSRRWARASAWSRWRRWSARAR